MEVLIPVKIHFIIPEVEAKSTQKSDKFGNSPSSFTIPKFSAKSAPVINKGSKFNNRNLVFSGNDLPIKKLISNTKKMV